MRSCAEAFQVRMRESISFRPLILETVAHKVYGVPQTINSANYVYFLAYQELFTLRSGVGVDPLSDDRKRLIQFEELDRIVTGELEEGIRYHHNSHRSHSGTSITTPRAGP